MSFQLAEADRRLENVATIGVVTAVNAAAARVRVQIGDLASPEIPVMQLSAGGKQFWWMPTVGEQVVILAPGGDMARAVMIGSLYASNAPSADPNEPRINLAGGHMVIDGNVTITGDVVIQGAVHIVGQTTSDADVVASGISLVTHVHLGVIPGPSLSGGPQ